MYFIAASACVVEAWRLRLPTSVSRVSKLSSIIEQAFSTSLLSLVASPHLGDGSQAHTSKEQIAQKKLVRLI